MAFELAAYGLIAGLIYNRLGKSKISIYISLIVSMVFGRIIWGIVAYFLFGLQGTAFTWQIFTAGAFFNAIPGIIIQLLIIPIIIMAAERYKVGRRQ
jgi:small basic protein